MPLKIPIMGLSSFFNSGFSKVPTPKQFNYIPRYYDPEQEARKKRQERRLKMEKGAFFEQGNRSPIVGAFTSGRYQESARQKMASAGSQFVRVMIIAVILGMAAAFMLGYIDNPYTMAGMVVVLLVMMVVFILKGSHF